MTKTLVYVSCSTSREIQAFSIDTITGQLTRIQSCPMPAMPQPLRISPDHRLLFAGLRAPDGVASLAIDPENGSLALLGHVPVPGPATFVASDLDRKVLFCASWGGNFLSLCPLNDQGIPQPVAQTENDLPHAHAAVMDASNRWLLVPMLGADAIRVYRLNANKHVVPSNPPMVHARKGSGPRHLVFTADNRHVYCLNELDGSIDLFAFDSADGALRLEQSVNMLPPGCDGKPWAAELRITPDDRFLYATDRTASVIAAFAVDQSSGKMSLIGHFPTEPQPRGMGIDASGRWLVAAGQLNAHLTVYAIDQLTGQLQPVSRQSTGDDPICVEFLSLPVT